MSLNPNTIKSKLRTPGPWTQRRTYTYSLDSLLSHLAKVFGQTCLNSTKPDQTSQKAVFDQGPYCKPHTQQPLRHQQTVKMMRSNCRTSMVEQVIKVSELFIYLFIYYYYYYCYYYYYYYYYYFCFILDF